MQRYTREASTIKYSFRYTEWNDLADLTPTVP